MYPATSDRNRMPTSTLLTSASCAPTAVDPFQIVHGHDVGIAPAVVNVQKKFDAIGLPARSLTPPDPPHTATEYFAPGASGLAGINVAVGVSPPEVMVAGTRLPPGSRSSNDDAVRLDALIISLKVAVTTVVVGTTVAPSAGVIPATIGVVVSTAVDVAKTTSTQ